MKEQFISWDTFYENATTGNIAPAMAREHRRSIEKRLKSYMEQKYPAYLSHNNGEIRVRRDLLDKDDLSTYFQYEEGTDYSAEDIAKQLLNHIGIPPADTMSLESVEKKVRELFDLSKYKDSVYVKRSSNKGGHSICCVDLDTVHRIENDQKVMTLIYKQIKKAKQKQKDSDSVGWKRYESEEKFIESREEMERTRQSGETDDTEGLSESEKIRYMTEALFSLFFTDFDFDALNKDIADYNTLIKSMDFGRGYQELDTTFSTPHFGWKYYDIKDSPLLDKLADKVATAILKQMKENGG